MYNILPIYKNTIKPLRSYVFLLQAVAVQSKRKYIPNIPEKNANFLKNELYYTAYK